MKRTCILSAALFLVHGAVAQTAETNKPPTVTNGVAIATLVAEALQGNPENRFYEAELEAAKAGRRTAGAWPDPEVSGTVGNKSVRSGGINSEGVAWSVSVMQSFEWPGRIGLRKAIANRDVELAELGYSRFRVALAGRVRLLAYQLFAAQQKSAAAGEVAARFQALREIVVQRDPAGLTPLLETRIIEATELTAQHRASEAGLTARTTLLELNQLRGITPSAQLIVRPAEFQFRASENLEVLQTQARSNNFELRVRAAELAQQGYRVALAKNERYPSLAVGPAYSEENAGDRERILGVGVTMPLPLWNRNAGNIESAAARRIQAETSLLLAQREVERRVVEAAVIYQAKVAEMGRWRPDAVEHFREAAELADRHYRLGAVPIATYVELQKQYLEAVENLLETKKEALEAAQTLELLTGLEQPLAATKEENK